MGFMDVNWIVLGRAVLMVLGVVEPLPGGCATADGGGTEKDCAPMPWMPSGDEAKKSAGPGWTGVAGGRAMGFLADAAADAAAATAAAAAAAAAAVMMVDDGVGGRVAKDEDIALDVAVCEPGVEAVDDDDDLTATGVVEAVGERSPEVDDEEEVVVVPVVPLEDGEEEVTVEAEGLLAFALVLAFS
jgi:hypothetical protein